VKTRSEGDLLRDLVPPIRRARGFRLYDRRGRRYLDLFLNDGSAVLGHRPDRVNNELKAVVSKGGLFAMPSVYPGRLAGALGRAYPAFAGVLVAADETEAVGFAARYLKCEPSEVEIRDPALGQEGRVIRDRPCLPRAMREQAIKEAEVVLPLLPFRIDKGPAPVLFRGRAPEAKPGWIAPAVAAAALRAFYDLDRRERPDWYSDDLLEGCDGWVQRGIYVAPRFPSDRYAGVFARFLEAGVLLPPEYPGPAVLPGEASAGEVALLMRLFGEKV
jgi:hypothetical protein